jgi:hypothetical protein
MSSNNICESNGIIQTLTPNFLFAHVQAKHAIIAQLKAPFPCGLFGVTYSSEMLGFFNAAPRIQFSQAFPFGHDLIRMFHVNVEVWEYF